MLARISRRTLLAGCTTGFALPATELAERIGIMCQFEPEESAARAVLDTARQAGFQRAQVSFPWERATPGFLRALPGWIADSDMRVEVLGACVNCASPGTVLMGTRPGDFDRAIEFAPEIGARRLTAWTGGYGPDLMTADPRNFEPRAAGDIRRFLQPRLKRLQANRIMLALETYITLACPDAPGLLSLLRKLPRFVGAVLDPPNMTPLERYGERDLVMREMFRLLESRVGVVHLKDFRLARNRRAYELPGPMAGEMNYPLFTELIAKLPVDTPVIAEHLKPGEFREARKKLVELIRSPRRAAEVKSCITESL